jgi:hypothetical protein
LMKSRMTPCLFELCKVKMRQNSLCVADTDNILSGYSSFRGKLRRTLTIKEWRVLLRHSVQLVQVYEFNYLQRTSK